MRRQLSLDLQFYLLGLAETLRRGARIRRLGGTGDHIELPAEHADAIADQLDIFGSGLETSRKECYACPVSSV